jgi:hypothetical protein
MLYLNISTHDLKHDLNVPDIQILTLCTIVNRSKGVDYAATQSAFNSLDYSNFPIKFEHTLDIIYIRKLYR